MVLPVYLVLPVSLYIARDSEAEDGGWLNPRLIQLVLSIVYNISSLWSQSQPRRPHLTGLLTSTSLENPSSSPTSISSPAPISSPPLRLSPVPIQYPTPKTLE